MTTTTIYNHPDGHQIVVGDGLLTACTGDGVALSMPIGPDGMEALGRELIERASGEKHDAAERAGGALGNALMDDLIVLLTQECDQAAGISAIQESLGTLITLEPFERAAGGFAVALVNVLQIGLMHLPDYSRTAGDVLTKKGERA